MESVLQVAKSAVAQGRYEISVFTNRILRIDGITSSHEHDYLQESTFFSYASLQESLHALEQNEVVDAILVHRQAINPELTPLVEMAREKAVPVFLYTPKFEKSAKAIARDHHLDDYHHGAITDVFLKKIESLKKLKSYKLERGHQPYETFTEEAPRFQQWALKRAMDVAVSFTAILLLLPLLVLLALIIKLESRGPVFYISKRAGAGYRIFNFYKFRSMRTGADKELNALQHLNQYSENSEKKVFFKLKNDPRVTPFGSFLRKTSLDELPQLFNVLLGDMSLVGNRPLPLYEAAQLTNDQIAWRFLAPAGITGLWQITKRGKENMSPEERIALDMEYAMKCSFLLDLKILVSTFPALLQKEKV